MFELSLKFDHDLSDAQIDAVIHWVEAHDCIIGGGGSEYSIAADSIVKIAQAVRDFERSGVGDINPPEFVASED